MRDGGSLTRPTRGQATTKLTKARRLADRHDHHVLAGPEIFVEGVESIAGMLEERLQEQPSSPRRRDPADRRAGGQAGEAGFKASGGLADFVKPWNGEGDIHTKTISMELARPRRRRCGPAMDERVLGVDPLLRQHDQHPRGRHARGGPQEGAHECDQSVRAHQGTAEGEGGQPPRRGRARGADRHRERPPARAAVRGPDQDQARQHDDALARRDDRERAPHDVAPGAPRRREADRHEVLAGREGASCGQAGPRPDAAQVVPGGRRATRQAGRLPADRPERHGAVHRRGRLGGGFGQAGPRPGDPGDPSDPGQDPERREVAAPQDPRERRDPGADHGDRHGRGDESSRREDSLPQDRADCGRRCGRRAHPDCC